MVSLLFLSDFVADAAAHFHKSSFEGFIFFSSLAGTSGWGGGGGGAFLGVTLMV